MSLTPHGTNFTLRTPAHIKSCHMTGSWDNYSKRYALTPDPSAPGYWTLTVKFGSSMPAGRHWYYYILDGYFESHDPNRPTCVQPERNLTLNILDHIERSPSASSSGSSSSGASSSYRYASSPDSMSSVSPTGSKRSGTHRRNRSRESRDGRTPSPRRINASNPHIVHPKPRNPLGHHKLTLDTGVGPRYSSQIAGASPVSAGSGRSSASSCSACSGSTWSDGSSPTTPICTCLQAHVRGDCDYDSEGFYDEFEEDYDSEDDAEFDDAKYRRLSRHGQGEKKMAYAPTDELAYRMERGLRI